MSSVSTHVLDTSRGRPAAALPVQLFQQTGDGWSLLAEAETNSDGRLPSLADVGSLGAGIYRMHFQTGVYFAALGQRAFYPWVDVVFELPENAEHYHVPLLLAAYGYSTYRGS